MQLMGWVTGTLSRYKDEKTIEWKGQTDIKIESVVFRYQKEMLKDDKVIAEWREREQKHENKEKQYREKR